MAENDGNLETKKDSIRISERRSKWPLVFALLIPTILSVIAFGVISCTSHYKNLTDSILAQRKAMAHLITLTLNERFTRLKEVGLSLATRRAFARHVAAGEWLEAIAIMESVPTQFSYIDRIFITDPSGTLMADTPSLAGGVRGKNFSHRDWYKGVSEQWQPYLSFVYVRSALPRRQVLALAVPIRAEESGAVVGVLVLQVQVDTFIQWLRDMDIGPASSVFFIDKARNVINASGAGVSQGKDFPAFPFINRVIRGEKGSGIILDPSLKQNLLVVYEPVPGYDWGCVIVEPVASAFALRDRSVIFMVILFFLIIAINGLMLVLIYRMVSRIRKTEEKFKQFVESAPDALVIVNKAGKIVLVNLQAENLFGYKREELVGCPVETLVPVGLRQKHEWHRMEFSSSPQARKMGVGLDLQALHKDGRTFPVEISLSPLESEEGLLVAASIRDISDRIEAQEELKKAKVAAEAANQAKSNFLATMSHELRTPLNAIMGFSEVLQAENFGHLNAKQKEYVRDIWESGEHLLSLINDILDISKVESGKLSLELAKVDLKHLLNNAFLMFKEKAMSQNIRLSLGLDEELDFVVADERKLKQIMFNLLSNAIKFTPESGKVTVNVKKENNKKILFSVEDTGIGIMREDNNKLFKEFVRIDHAHVRATEGTGLGLALSRRLVKMHGGKIWFKSGGENKGTTFYFTIPYIRPQEQKEASIKRAKGKQAQAGQPVESSKPNNPLALLIEDDPKSAKLIAGYLVEYGYRTMTVARGEEGLEKAKELKPSLIILDIILPEKNGWDVLIELKLNSKTKAIPILVTTVVYDRQKGMALGAADYLIKPIAKEDVVEVLKKLSFFPVKEGRSMKILTIDDETVTLKIMESILASLGVVPLLSQSGKEGLRLAKEERPDLILLDLVMPEMTGFDVLLGLRGDELTRHIPVIVVTAKNLTSEEKHFLHKQVAFVIQKSDFSKEALLKEIRMILGEKGD